MVGVGDELIIGKLLFCSDCLRVWVLFRWPCVESFGLFWLGTKSIAYWRLIRWTWTASVWWKGSVGRRINNLPFCGELLRAITDVFDVFRWVWGKCFGKISSILKKQKKKKLD